MTKCIIGKILSKCDGDRFCLNCFCDFQADEKLKEHEKSCRNHHYAQLEIPAKFKRFLNKKNVKLVKVRGNLLKHSLLNKSLQPHFIVVYGI